MKTFNKNTLTIYITLYTFRIYTTLYNTYQLLYCNGTFRSQVITASLISKEK